MIKEIMKKNITLSLFAYTWQSMKAEVICEPCIFNLMLLRYLCINIFIYILV